MRIGIDARFYGPRSTGIGRYVERLLHELDRLATDHQFTVFLHPDHVDEFKPANERRFEKVIAPWRWYSFGEQRGMPTLVRRSRLDLVHFPHFNVPVLTNGRFVVTVHDLILNKFPTERASTLGPALYRVKHAAYTYVIRRAVRRSRHVLAVSENTKRDILETYHVPNEKVTVTYEGCDLPGERDIAGIDVAGRYGITRPFALYVGNAYPHKNLERLIEAAAKLQFMDARRPQIVIAGKEDYFYRRLREYARRRLPAESRDTVRFPGFVDDRILNALYASAEVYIFPSLYEGFGLPGLEAMARGVPVAAARASCLPEIYGQAAEYFDPNSSEDIARTLAGLFSDASRREVLRQRGYEQVRRYSWRRMAEQTLGVYNTVVSQSD